MPVRSLSGTLLDDANGRVVGIKNTDGSESLFAFGDTAGAKVLAATTATSATTGTMTVPMPSVNGGVVTITPTNACTFNATGGTQGARCTFIVTTSGTSSFVLTFGTNFKSTGTLSTGTADAKIFTVSFVCGDGTVWTETGRTAAM